MNRFVNSSSHKFSTENQNGKSFNEDTGFFYKSSQNSGLQLYSHRLTFSFPSLLCQSTLRDRGWPSKVVAGRNRGLDFVQVFLFPTGHLNCGFNSESGSHCH